MKNSLFITNENVAKSLNLLTYGTTILSYDSEETRRQFLEGIIVLNEFYGKGSIEEQMQDVGGNLIYSALCRIQLTQQLSDNDFSIKKVAKIALKTNSVINHAINEKLNKYASKLAKEMGLKYGFDVFGFYYDGRVKSKSLSNQITEAFNSGVDKMDFDLSSGINTNSIRCYVSNLSSISGQKIRCEIKHGKLTIYFKEPSINEVKYNNLMEMIDSCECILTQEQKNNIVDKVNDIYYDWSVDNSNKTEMVEEVAEKSKTDYTDDEF